MIEIAAILQYAGEHGPFLFVIFMLFRAVHKKDETITALSGQLAEIAQAQHRISRVLSSTIEGDGK